MRERRFQFFPNKLLQVDIPAGLTIHKRKVKLLAAAQQPVSQYVVLLCYCVSQCSLQKQKLVPSSQSWSLV